MPKSWLNSYAAANNIEVCPPYPTYLPLITLSAPVAIIPGVATHRAMGNTAFPYDINQLSNALSRLGDASQYHSVWLEAAGEGTGGLSPDAPSSPSPTTTTPTVMMIAPIQRTRVTFSPR